MWNLDVDKIPHPHISSEVDPGSPLVVESDERFKRHHHFFFADDNVVFQVEDTRFKIHRYFFQRDSEIFAAVFALPGGPGYGASDYNPIRLVGIRAKDFDIFLSILYPPKFGVYAATNVDEWNSVLDLASKWKFESIKALAIEKLAVIASPIDRIVLGRRYEITEWLVDAYTAACERSSALTLEEAGRLGLEDVVKISFLRQEIRTLSSGPARASVDVVSTTFGLDRNQREGSPVEEGNDDQVVSTPHEPSWLEESSFSFRAPRGVRGIPSSDSEGSEIAVEEKKRGSGAQMIGWGSSSKKSSIGAKRGERKV